ncbi:MAG: aminopeptidase P family protein [Anaerolineaceae bacterium]|nr:aminopeptidase P family protein [Anaerolineaceae bacterium]
MKADLNRLMKEKKLDAILVIGRSQHNPAMVYFTGTAHITRADLIVQVDKEPVLFHPSMEREEAAATGIRTIDYNQYPMPALLKEAGNDMLLAMVMRYEKMFAEAGLKSGKVAIYGENEIGAIFSVLTLLQKRNPKLEFVGYQQEDLLLSAMATKSSDELAHIREMGERTIGVVSQVKAFLTNHKVVDDILIKEDGKPLTIADVKRKINLWLAASGAENPESTIFAIGRDGGVPHSTGTASDVIRLGVPIVFDIFPCEEGGGYFYDFTRTWCLGYAPPEVEIVYNDVRKVYDTIVNELELNKPFKQYQARTCELFRELGHATVEENPKTEEGYVHSLGHGVGLHVHEMPFAGAYATPSEILAAGSVFTIEPGLYYPEKGLGVRLEDTYYAEADGSFHCFVPYPFDLVLPMKQS